jgi:hypothetical protein
MESPGKQSESSASSCRVDFRAAPEWLAGEISIYFKDFMLETAAPDPRTGEGGSGAVAVFEVRSGGAVRDWTLTIGSRMCGPDFILEGNRVLRVMEHGFDSLEKPWAVIETLKAKT